MSRVTASSGSTLRNVGTAMSWSVLSRVIRQIFGMASSIIIVRSLGKMDYGIYALLMSVLTFGVAIGRGGLTQAMLRYVPELKMKGAGAGMRLLLRTVIQFQLGLTVVIVVVGWLLRNQVAQLFDQPALAGLLALGLGLAIFEVYHDTINESAIALYETKTVAVAAVLGSIVTLAGVILFVKMGWGIAGVLVAAGVGHLAVILVLARKVLQCMRAGRSDTGESISRKRLFNYAFPFLAINVMVLITWRQSETVFLSYYWTPVEAGLFDLAYRVPQRMLEFIPGAVYPLVMAGFSEAITKNLDSMRRGIVMYYRLLFLMVAPISVFGMLYADRFIEVMYGAEMAAAGPVCQIFFLVFMASFFGTPLSMAIYAVEKTWVNMIFYLVSTVVIVGLDLLLIPPYGLWGAIIPVAVITVASPFARYLLARHFVGSIRIPWRFILRMYLASAPLGLFFPFRERIDSPAALVAFCAIAGVLTVAAIRLCRVFGAEERELLEKSNFPMRRVILRLW
ncbi:MAG: oligosaccharide flippase family protein [Candidatus Eisenbacteria sp.]|nr:oligosaccharide flippase family protein [Candidatus Eisenbacteria bacterium]